MKGGKYSVSVVMPTYNRKDLVSEHIGKLLYEQDYSKDKYEIIVVDDGSRDKTSKHLKDKYKKEIKEGRLKVLRQDNHGLSAARNLGIKHASGEYICRMDDDDPPLPNRIKDSIDYFKKNPDKRLMHAKSYWIDEKGQFLDNGKMFKKGLNVKREHWAKKHDLENKTEDYLLEEKNGSLRVSRNVIHGGTTMAHKSLYDDIENIYGHVYDPTVTTGEDRDLWSRIAKLSRDKSEREIGFLNKIVANYLFTKDQAIKQEKKLPRRKDLFNYINKKLDDPKQFYHVVFSEADLDNKDLIHYLQKIARRGYRRGHKLKFVLKDKNSGNYKVRLLDSDAVLSKKGDFFNRRVYDQGNLEEIIQNHEIENADAIEIIDDIDLHSEVHNKIENNPERYFTLIGNEGFIEDKSDKRKNISSGEDRILLHPKISTKLESLIKKESPKKKLYRWIPLLK